LSLQDLVKIKGITIRKNSKKFLKDGFSRQTAVFLKKLNLIKTGRSERVLRACDGACFTNMLKSEFKKKILKHFFSFTTVTKKIKVVICFVANQCFFFLNFNGKARIYFKQR
jgi:hypothetical protein